MPPKKLTAQPVRVRHFAGKHAAEVEAKSSSSEAESEDEKPKQKPLAKQKPGPVASSFPKAGIKASLAQRNKAEAARKALEEEFETESEEEGPGGEEGSERASEEESSSEESSSEEETPRTLVRPVFIKKKERDAVTGPVKSVAHMAVEQEARQQAERKAILQAQIEHRVAEKAAAQRDWDDHVEDADMDAIDDTDGLDPHAEYAAWKLRELRRITRERRAIEEAEAERAEIDRRRTLSAAEREAEDRVYMAKQQDEQGDKGGMQFMQKYFHKGAFFTDELKELGVEGRRVMNARFEDQTNREVLPEFMQIRDMTKLGKKGRTRYKDMRSEDTGQWGEYADDRKRRDKGEYGVDARFRSDARGREREDGATGANARPLGERKRGGEEGERNGKRARLETRRAMERDEDCSSTAGADMG